MSVIKRLCVLFVLAFSISLISVPAYADDGSANSSEVDLEEMSYSAYSEDEGRVVTPIPLSECRILYHAPDRNYTGSAIEPDKPRVVVSQETMRNHGIPITDFYGYGFEVPSSSVVVSYKNNIDAGKATMVVSVTKTGFGMGGYLGEAQFSGEYEIDFNIMSAHIANAEAAGLDKVTTIHGAMEKPDLVFKGRRLEEGVDYTLEYHNANRPGTAWLDIKGIGNFYGDSWWRYDIDLRKNSFSGSQRYETCELINNEELNLENPKGVIIASGEDGRYPDALCASGLSGALGYPIVLVNGSGNGLDSYSRKSMEAFSDASGGNLDIVIVGGTSAVSPDIEGCLSEFGGVSARLGGDTRYDTSIKIYDYGRMTCGWSSNHVILARGDDFADSLSIAPFACLKKVPVLLSPLDSQRADSVCDRLANHGEAIVVGGEAAVSRPMFEHVSAIMGGKAVRLAGSDRYETSAAVVTWELENGLSAKCLGFARGDSFPDSLAASYYLSQRQCPLLLVGGGSADGNSLAKKLVDSLSSSVGEFSYFGGASSISNDVRKSLEDALEGPYGWKTDESSKYNTVCTTCGLCFDSSSRHDHILERCPSCNYLGNADSLGRHLYENAFGLSGCSGGNYGNSGNESINSNHRTYFGH